MNLTTYTQFGMTGLIPVEAKQTFDRKREAVAEAGRLRATASTRSLQEHTDAIGNVFKRIQAANRTIRRNGWFFYVHGKQPAGSVVVS